MPNIGVEMPNRGVMLAQFLQNFHGCGQLHARLMFQIWWDSMTSSAIVVLSAKFTAPPPTKLRKKTENVLEVQKMACLPSTTCSTSLLAQHL